MTAASEQASQGNKTLCSNFMLVIPLPQACVFNAKILH